MPKASRNERYMHDLQHVYTSLYEVLTPRGFFAECSLLLMVNLRRPSELRDVVVELLVRARSGGSPVWRAQEGLKIPGRMKLRSMSDVLCGLMLRAAYDIESIMPVPGTEPPQSPAGRARP